MGKFSFRKKGWNSVWKKSQGARRFRKSVANIAKTVVNKQAETKTLAYGDLGSYGTNGRFVNIWKQCAKGTEQYQRVGDRLHALGVKIRGFISIDPAIITANTDGVVVRMVVFSGKRPINTITDSGLTYNGSTDPELLNIHLDRFVTFKIDGRCRVVNTYVKFNRVVTYNPTGTDPSKNELYVAFIPVQNVGVGLTATQGIYNNLIFQPYYKDI